MRTFDDEEYPLATGGGDFEYTPPEIDEPKKTMRKDVYEYVANALKQQTSRPSDIAFYAFTGENLPPPQKTPDIVTPMDVDMKEAELMDRQAMAKMREAQAKKYVADSMKKESDLRKLEPTGFSVAKPGDSQFRSGTVYVDPYTGKPVVVPLPEGAVQEKTLDRNLEYIIAMERLRQGQQPEQMAPGKMSEKDRIELEARLRREQLEREAELRKDLEREKNKLNKETAKPTPTPFADMTYDQKLQSLNTTDKTKHDGALMGLTAVENMKKALKSGAKKYSLKGDNEYTMARRLWEESIGRLSSGGAISGDEERRFRAMAPGVLDEPEIVQKKLDFMQQEMESRLKTLGFNPSESLARRNMGAVVPGTIKTGKGGIKYKFKGGDPKDKANWEQQ